MKSANSAKPLPAERLQDQERGFARAFALLEQAVRERVFPGACLAVVRRGELVAWRGVGRFTYDASSPAVHPETVFDLASVTKVLATTAMAMVLHERGLLQLEQPVVELLPEFALTADRSPSKDERRRQVTVRMLLAHSSGLIDYEKLFLRAHTRRDLLWLALTSPLVEEPMTRGYYSDTGFIVLGEVLARLAGPLDEFCEREIFHPLGMGSARFCPPAECKTAIPPTMDDREFRMRVIQGEVNDENASVMGGVAGHAGLFSNAFDVALFGQCMLTGGSPILKAETVHLFTTRESRPKGTSRALGWDTPSAPSQSGRHFSAASFGHLGYTGTSLWCDPERQLCVALLTNRTWPDRGTDEIKRVRPLVHDAIVEAIQEIPG